MREAEGRVLRKAYRFQLMPTAAQVAALEFMAGARRFTYNWALERRKNYYQVHGKGIPKKQLSRELTALKQQPGAEWLKGADSQALQQALRDLDRAFEAFFAKRARYPRFRSKKRDVPTFRVPQRVKLEAGRVYVPKVGWVRIRQSREAIGTIKGATFKQSPTGKWFVTLTAEFEKPDLPLPAVDPAQVVGVDVGLESLVALDDGRKVAAPKHLRRTEKQLARAQRALSRKEKGSNNRARAHLKVARLHEKVKNQRLDHLHKLTTRLVNESDAVCIEDLPLKGLARTKLAKSIHDAALGELRRQLEYKTVWSRKRLLVVGRYYPSSKTCGACGLINQDLKLSDRSWSCTCGVMHDRDVNAARNIRTEGLRMLVAAGHAETLNACGGDVRPPALGRRTPAKQESHRL